MAVTLHTDALEFLRGLIQQGRFNLDGEWEANKPTTESENAYLDDHNYEEYGKWFLGIDLDADPNTRERYSFPVGNFKKIFRSGVIAAEQRAAQYGHEEIKKAAHELREMMPK